MSVDGSQKNPKKQKQAKDKNTSLVDSLKSDLAQIQANVEPPSHVAEDEDLSRNTSLVDSLRSDLAQIQANNVEPPSHGAEDENASRNTSLVDSLRSDLAQMQASSASTFTPGLNTAVASATSAATDGLFSATPSSAPAPTQKEAAPSLNSLTKKLNTQSNKDKWNIASHQKIDTPLPHIEVNIKNGGRAVIAENGQGGLNYRISTNVHGAEKDKTIAAICKMAVDTAQPNTLFNLERTPDDKKEKVFNALRSALLEKGVLEQDLPILPKDYRPSAAPSKQRPS